MIIPAAPTPGVVTDPNIVRLLEDLYSTINYADKRCFVLDGQVEKANDQLARMRKRLGAVTPAKEAAERKLFELEAVERRDRQEIAMLKGEVTQLRKQMREASGDRRSGDKTVADLEAQLGRVRDEAVAMRRDRDRERDNAEAARAQLLAKTAMLEGQLKGGLAQATALRQERDRVTGLVAERDDYIRSLESDLQAARSGLGPLKKQAAEAAHLRGDYELTIREANEQARRDADDLASLRRQLADRDAQVRKGAEALARLEAKAAADLARLDGLEDRSLEEKSDRDRVVAKRERDRLHALVSQAEARVVELEEAARRDQADLTALRRQLKEVSGQVRDGSDASAAATGWARDRAALEEAAREAREAAEELCGKAARLEKDLARARAEAAEAADTAEAVRYELLYGGKHCAHRVDVVMSPCPNFAGEQESRRP